MLVLLLMLCSQVAAPVPPPTSLQATVQAVTNEFIELDLGWASEHLTFYLEPDVDVQSLIVKLNWFPAVEGEEYNVSRTEQAVVVVLCCEYQTGDGSKVEVRYRRKRRE